MTRHRLLRIGATLLAAAGSVSGPGILSPGFAAASNAPVHSNHTSAAHHAVPGRPDLSAAAPYSSVFVPNATTGPWEIYNYGAGKVLDGNQPTAFQNGSRVQLWNWRNTRIQKWYVVNGDELKNEYSGKCLDAPTPFLNGGKIQLWTCNGGPRQMWGETGAGGTELASYPSHKCLDGNLPTASRNGSKVQLWTCHEGAVQIWYAYKVRP